MCSLSQPQNAWAALRFTRCASPLSSCFSRFRDKYLNQILQIALRIRIGLEAEIRAGSDNSPWVTWAYACVSLGFPLPFPPFFLFQASVSFVSAVSHAAGLSSNCKSRSFPLSGLLHRRVPMPPLPWDFSVTPLWSALAYWKSITSQNDKLTWESTVVWAWQLWNQYL